MKFQTTLAFTLLLLIAMVGAGTVSALYGFTLGYDALKGVKQPESNPSQQLIHSRKGNDNQGKNEIQLVSERDVIVAVYDKIHAQERELKKQKQKPEQEPKSSFVKEPDAQESAAKAAEKSPFPLASESEDISLEIVNGRLLGSYWVMDVNLQNNSRESVNFLYNFLEIKDDQGRLLSVETAGLPPEIPANNQSYSGTISIPAVILEDSKTLSLQLQDYPNREISLEISEIPVVR